MAGQGQLQLGGDKYAGALRRIYDAAEDLSRGEELSRLEANSLRVKGTQAREEERLQDERAHGQSAQEAKELNEAAALLAPALA